MRSSDTLTRVCTCAAGPGGKVAMKPAFVGGGACTVGALAMTGTGTGAAGVAMDMETGGWVIMGCWCGGMTGARAMARPGRLGMGGDGN